jgi:type III secretion protein N (ATPase)
VSEEQLTAAGRIRELMAKYEEIELLVKVGEYRQGTDQVADEALTKIDHIRQFLKQRTDELTDYDSTLQNMIQLAR